MRVVDNKELRDKYEKEILEVIKNENIFCIQDIFAFYKGCTTSTFYNHELEKLETIKRAIEDNKIITKHSLKAKWAESDNPTLQIALFKTICSEEERRQLSQNYNDHTTNGKEITGKYSDWTPEQIRAEIERLRDK